MTADLPRTHQLSNPSDEDISQAALVWAAASAHRDGVPAEPWENKLPGIRRRLTLPDSVMLLAQSKGSPVGFATMARGEHRPELFYLAVHPDSWGSGIAALLLREVDHWAAEHGHLDQP